MRSDFKTTVAVRGVTSDASDYLSAWSNTLDKQYKRAQKSFLKVGKQDEDNNEELLLLALLTWRKENKENQAQLITNTNRKQMNEALSQARFELSLTGEIPTNRELALTATAILKKKFKGRVSGIAMTETQASSESTKFIQAEVDKKWDILLEKEKFTQSIKDKLTS